MSWRDLGLIFRVNDLNSWAKSHFYVPVVLDRGDTIRIYGAFWDAYKYGRLGYVDLHPETLAVLKISDHPCMDDSPKGAFDCDGVTPLCAYHEPDGRVRMYYAGWQRDPAPHIRYSFYTGVAFSNDGGETFVRYQEEPIMGPNTPESETRTGFIMPDGDTWRCWCTDYAGALELNGKRVPSYNLGTMTSPDGLHWSNESTPVFTVHDRVFGYGRAAVWKENQLYHGLFGIRHMDHGYRDMFYATSKDGATWTTPSHNGYAFSASQTRDNQAEVAFPALHHQEGRILMFYNGDAYGQDGLRAAVWIK